MLHMIWVMFLAGKVFGITTVSWSLLIWLGVGLHLLMGITSAIQKKAKEKEREKEIKQYIDYLIEKLDKK